MVKSVLGVLLALCVVPTMMVWTPGIFVPQDQVIAWLKIILPVLCVSLLTLLIWAQSRRDKAPDFLAHVSRRYFERDGFCFALVPRVHQGHHAMDVYFQNRHDRCCAARVVLKVCAGPFTTRPEIGNLDSRVACGPAEYGYTSIPWPIPPQLQGTKLTLNIYADVRYPEGRGKLLRYRNGVRVRAASGDIVETGLFAAAALAGHIVIARTANITVKIPAGVSSTLPDASSSRTWILWKPGDPVPHQPGLLVFKPLDAMRERRMRGERLL